MSSPIVEEPPVPVPPRRADARRNHDAIVAAAREAFGREGVDTSIDDIARAAGVGSATLYRHFPTRDDLILAAIAQHTIATHRRGAELLSAEDAVQALHEWLFALVERLSTYGGLPANLLDAVGDEQSRLGITCARMQELNTLLLARAQAAGGIRADLTPRELFQLASGVAWTVSREHPPDRGARLLGLTLEGLRPR